MVRPFRTTTDRGATTFTAGLSTPERLVLAQVTGDVVELLGGEESLYESEEDGAGPGAGALPDGSPDAPLEDDTDAAIRGLFDGMSDGMSAEPAEAPTDPAVRRLIPDASSDPEIAQEFRRFTDDDLRQHKVERLLLFAQLLLEAAPSSDEMRQLDFVVLDDEAEPIAGALADIRLVIGERLSLRTDADSQALYDLVTASWGDDSAPTGGADDVADADDPVPVGAPEDSGPRLFLGSVFVLAGYLQESLTECLIERYRRAASGA